MKTFVRDGLAIVLASTLAAGAELSGCANHNAATSRLCDPGTWVLCRCDGQGGDGSKQCAADGMSFGACTPCDSGDGGDDAGPDPGEDAGPDPGDDAGRDVRVSGGIDPACANKLAVVAGSGASDATTFTTSIFDGSSFVSTSNDGTPMRSRVSVLATSEGAVAAWLTQNDGVAVASFSGGTWNAPEAPAAVSAKSAPGLAPWGSALKAVYLGTDGLYHATTRDPSAGWDGAPQLVGSDTQPAISNGSAPAAATAGTPGVPGSSVVVGFTDDSGGIYRQEWHGSSWFSRPIKANAVLAAAMTPSLVATTGGAYDLLSTYVGQDGTLQSALRMVRDAGTAWSTPGLVDARARPAEGPSVVALDGGRAIAVYIDATKKPFFSVFDGSKSPSWTAVAPLFDSANPTVASTPSLVRDTCGADAALVYVDAGGTVAVTRFAAGSWSLPTPIVDITNATYAAIAAAP